MHHYIPRVNAPEKDQSRKNECEIDDVINNNITGSPFNNSITG